MNDPKEMVITCENRKISTNIGDDLIKGLQILLATYFMYDLEYPKGSKGVLKFLQERLLGIPLHKDPGTTYNNIARIISFFERERQV